MKEIIGKKLGMTRIFRPDGEAVSVTVIEAGPCPVLAKRTPEKHGYTAYQVGFGEVSKKHVNKPKAGQFTKANVEAKRHLREIRFDDAEFEVGATIKADMFKVGEKIDVTGISRGLGFQGTMKLHNFNGAQKTHGQSDRWRAPGSIGSSSYPSRVFRGLRMASRMGLNKVTVLKLEIAQIIENENLILVKGSVPGVTGSLVKIRTTNRGR